MRAMQRAPLSDGAVALVLASEKFLRANPGCKPLARIAGVGWATDSYRLDGARLKSMNSARKAWDAAMTQAGLHDAGGLDVVLDPELERLVALNRAALLV